MIQIDTTNRIILNGQPTGLAVIQHLGGSTICRLKTSTTPFDEIKMPKRRYTLSTEAGQAEFEADIKAILNS